MKIRHIEECKNPGTIDKKNKFNYVVRTDEYNETTENLAGYMYSPNKVKITMVLKSSLIIYVFWIYFY